MGAVQAQDYKGALWAVGLRLVGAVEADVEAAIADRTIVRTWPMRGTLHLVPAEDARWMLRLLTPRVVARSAGRHRELSLDAAVFRRSERLLARALEGGRRLARPDVYAALSRGGVSPADQRGIHILAFLAQQGLICLGPREGRQHTFALLDEWVPRSKEPSRSQALATLATRYFSSHGPATLQDFAWWTGLLVKDAQEAILAAGSRLASKTGDGRPWWSASAASPRRKGRTPAAVLLPQWDEFIVAYKDREATTGHLQGRDRLGTVGRGLIVIDGRARGGWTRKATTGRVRAEPDFWTPVSAAERRMVDQAAQRYARFLESDAGS
jgi:hypothetical protein